ncbi:MAG: histidine kinase [Bacteroidales bacterium]|nr:histidine kinase [Bacteroidales bacterium]
MKMAFIINRKKKFKPIVLHVLGWSALFLLNFMFAKSYSVSLRLTHHLFTWTLYLAIFYLNYTLLMPKLLYRKHIFPYVILSLGLIICSFFIKDEIMTNLFSTGGPGGRERFDNHGRLPSEINKTGQNPVLRPPANNPGPPRKPFFFAYDLLLFYFASFSLRFIQKWKDDEEHKSELEKEKISTELSFLKQQINPHFLFNSLNSIYSLSLSKSEAATSSILKLSSILRYVLYESENKVVTLKDELKIIEDYIELQKLRLTDKVKLEVSIYGEPENYQIEPFILIPLIENAFKYGADNIYPSFIKISVTILAQKLDVTIQNKIVIKSNNGSNNSGIGIKNIERRLELLYPDDFIFITNTTNDIFTVHLELKLKK